MCGRIYQPSSAREYLDALGLPTGASMRSIGDGLRFNIPPGTTPITLCITGEIATATRTFWGYKPIWYDKPPVINARLDTIESRSRFWRSLLTHRIIIPVHGWYEWTGRGGEKQPWFIHAVAGQPLFLAGLAAGSFDSEPVAENGMAIITDASAGGMVDIHDRRPIALREDVARKWLCNETPIDEAIALLRSGVVDSNGFHWNPVTRRIGNIKYQSPDATTSILL